MSEFERELAREDGMIGTDTASVDDGIDPTFLATPDTKDPTADFVPLTESCVAVSVIVPVYNAAAYLATSLDSLLAQTLTDLEIICVDDGSTDGCLEILKEYREKDARVRILTQNNAGPSRARNSGLRRARGSFVAFVDADDFCEPTFLQTLYDAAVETGADLAIGGYDLYRDRIRRFTAPVASEHACAWQNGAISRSDLPDVLFQATDSYAWNKLLRRSFLVEKGLLFPEDITVFEDVYFVATALSMADRMYKTDAVLVHHRVYNAQTRNRSFAKGHGQIIEVFLRLHDFLMSHGMYLPLVPTYANFAASRLYKIYNLLGAEEKRIFWNRLHIDADALGFTESTLALLEDTDTANFVANVELYTYEQYMPRLLRGVKFRVQSFHRNRRTAKRRARVRSFFTSVFRHKKEEDTDA